MKIVIVLLISFLMGTTAMAGELEGRWKMVDRTCASGALTTDAILVGRDTILFDFDALKKTFKTLVFFGSDNRFAAQEGTYSANIDQLCIAPNSIISSWTEILGNEECYGYSKVSNILEINTDGFGPGGTCPIGDTLTTRFDLVQQ